MSKKLDSKKLKKMVKLLNESLDKKEQIKYVGVTNDDLVTAFTAKVAELAEAEVAVDAKVAEFYNSLTENADDAGEEEEDTSKKDKKGKKGKKEKKEKKKKEKKEPKPKKTFAERVVNTREYSVAQALKKGGSKSDLIKKADEIYVKQGGASNEKQSAKLLERGLKYFAAVDLLTIDNGKFKLSI